MTDSEVALEEETETGTLVTEKAILIHLISTTKLKIITTIITSAINLMTQKIKEPAILIGEQKMMGQKIVNQTTEMISLTGEQKAIEYQVKEAISMTGEATMIKDQ